MGCADSSLVMVEECSVFGVKGQRSSPLAMVGVYKMLC